jgi:hypothetical protein
MRLASLIERFEPELPARHGQRLLPGAHRALTAMQHCRSEAGAQLLLGCTQCPASASIAHSCGHRACPHCQHHQVEHWLARQREGLLPADYFLVTFTLPRQLRRLAFAHQRIVYDAMLRCAWQCLAWFAANDPRLGAVLGAVGVLHTHNRRRDFHPHVHFAVPAGGLESKTRRWRQKRRYLFNARNLAKVFRGKLLAALAAAGLAIPATMPRQWIADCRRVGRGDEALCYLARYLYRGVLSERDILACSDEGEVTFRYRDSNTRQYKTRTLHGAEFLWLLLQHVLPRGFRRARNYGLLHHKQRPLLRRIQCLLRTKLPAQPPVARRPLCCTHCGAPTRVLALRLRPDHARRSALPAPATWSTLM